MELSEEEKKAIDYLKNDVVYWLDKGKDFVVIDIGENEKLHSILNLIEKQQKEIEEKTTIIMAGAEKVKQLEKEIEGLKETNEDNAEKSLLNDIFIKKNYITKDKIREKIKELNSYYKEEVYPTRYQWGDIDITQFYDEQIELLKELLEE